jgi:hypothetical protein
MTTMIERLIGEGTVQRPDNRRILPVKRPVPDRPRDLFEVFSALGGEASAAALCMSIDLRDAKPNWMHSIVLNRWPTFAEVRARGVEYDPNNILGAAKRHLVSLIQSVEFRAFLAARVLTAYPEKTRLLFVRVPHCAGRHFLTLAETMHPIFPDAITGTRAALPPTFYPALGLFLARFIHTKTVLLCKPQLTPFRVAPAFATAEVAGGDPAETLPWNFTIPPYRTGDRLFTIVRDPEEIILGQVNAIAAALRWPGAEDPPDIRRWRGSLGALPEPEDAAGWVAVARRVLARFRAADPICHALGDGTTEGATQACIVTNIEIADLSRYSEWILRTWDTRPEPPEPGEPPILSREALEQQDRDRLVALTTQDRPLYDRIKAAISVAETSSITGSVLFEG